jgi:hypothetical protein
MAEAVINSVEEETCTMGNKTTEDNVLKMLFDQVQKPKSYYKIKAVNVYDNSYRINVWCEFEENNLTKRKIAYSYFAKVIDGSLSILQKSEPSVSSKSKW